MADALGTPGGVVSDEDHRLAMAGMIAPQSSTLAVRTGVMFGPAATTIVTGTATTGTMTVNVAAHHWVTSRAAGDGVYVGAKETTTVVPVGTAPGANSWIVLVYSKQNDSGSTISPDGSTGELYGTVTGTAAVSPTKPALPVGAVEIAAVQIASTATNTSGAGVTITNSAPLTVARGAPVPVRNTTERNALTTFPGLHVVRLDNGGKLEYWVSGTTWTGYAVPADIPSSTSGTLTLNSLYAATLAGGGTPKWRRVGQEMSLQGGVSNATTPYAAAAGATFNVATLPAGTAPATDQPFPAAYASGTNYAGAWVIVRSDGAVDYVPHAAAGPGFSLGFGGINWRIGA